MIMSVMYSTPSPSPQTNDMNLPSPELGLITFSVKKHRKTEGLLAEAYGFKAPCPAAYRMDGVRRQHLLVTQLLDGVVNLPIKLNNLAAQAILAQVELLARLPKAAKLFKNLKISLDMAFLNQGGDNLTGIVEL